MRTTLTIAVSVFAVLAISSPAEAHCRWYHPQHCINKVLKEIPPGTNEEGPKLRDCCSGVPCRYWEDLENTSAAVLMPADAVLDALREMGPVDERVSPDVGDRADRHQERSAAVAGTGPK